MFYNLQTLKLTALPPTVDLIEGHIGENQIDIARALDSRSLSTWITSLTKTRYSCRTHHIARVQGC